MTEQAESRRAELVEAAQTQWVSALTDLGGRNTLLYYLAEPMASRALVLRDQNTPQRVSTELPSAAPAPSQAVVLREDTLPDPDPPDD